MKIDPNAPAFPATRKETYTVSDGRKVVQGVEDKHYPGLTIRAHLAAMAMQALIPHIHADSMLGAGIDNMATSSKASKIGTVAAMAIEAADALIEALNNTERSNAQATQ